MICNAIFCRLCQQSDSFLLLHVYNVCRVWYLPPMHLANQLDLYFWSVVRTLEGGGHHCVLGQEFHTHALKCSMYVSKNSIHSPSIFRVRKYVQNYLSSIMSVQCIHLKQRDVFLHLRWVTGKTKSCFGLEIIFCTGVGHWFPAFLFVLLKFSTALPSILFTFQKMCLNCFVFSCVVLKQMKGV